MRQRCVNKKHPSYRIYGGRGISVHPSWQVFEPFRDWAIENGYADDLSIDRIDNNGSYGPDNCRWATVKEQQRNKRNNVVIQHDGVSLCRKEWAEKTGIPHTTIRARIARGLPADRALKVGSRMGRGYAGIWKRKGRANWYAWIAGEQVNLGTPSRDKALKEWHRLKGTQPRRERAAHQYVAVLIDQFLDHLHEERSRYYGWYRSRVRSFLKSIPARLTLAELRPSHVREWMKSHKAWSPTHKAGSISALQRALNWHVKDGSIKRNPIARIEKPARDRRKFVYSAEQAAALLVALREPARTFVALIAHTGCRPIELAMANGTDVAEDGATITVTQLKTDQDGPMPVPRSLRAWVLRLATAAKDGPLCRTERGCRWNRTTWSRAIAKAREDAGLPDEADAYAFRHTWITERIDAGDDVAEIANATRTSIAMISKVYDKASKDRSRRLADRLG